MTARVGIVVPVAADPGALRLLLACLRTVDTDGASVALRVVVDGADPDTIAEVARARPLLPGMDVAAVSLAVQAGSYAARNAGIDALPPVDVVVFTDADCLPSRQWIRGHLAALREEETSGGAILVTLRDPASPTEFVDRLRHLQQERYVREEGYAATANLAVRREVLDRLRFDGTAKTGGDADFGRRARSLGIGLAWAPAAVVEHPARATRRELLRKLRRISRGMAHQPERWQERPVPRPRPRRAPVRQARQEGVSRGPVWEAEVVLLNYLADRLIVRSAVRVGARVSDVWPPPADMVARHEATRATAGRPAVLYLLGKHRQPSQTFVQNEIDELRRQGARVIVLAAEHGRERPTDPDVSFLPDLRPGVATLSVDHARFFVRHPARYARMLAALPRLRSELGAAEEQVRWWLLPSALAGLPPVRAVHSHFGWNGAAGAWLAGALLGVPWSMTLHAKDIFVRRHNLTAKISAADLVVTVCDYNLAWMRTELGVTRPLERVVCGVEVPEQVRRLPGGPDIVAVGRLVPKKGFDLLVEAVALLREGGRDARTVVIGDGPELERLRTAATSRGVADLIELAGPLGHAEALDAIASSRVFCLPARIAPDGDRDSMPVVIKEAMVRGVPVVATDVVGIPEMVDASVGRLVRPDDAPALATALDELLGLSAGARATLGTAGRARVAERFTLAGETSRLAKLLGIAGPDDAAG